MGGLRLSVLMTCPFTGAFLAPMRIYSSRYHISRGIIGAFCPGRHAVRVAGRTLCRAGRRRLIDCMEAIMRERNSNSRMVPKPVCKTGVFRRPIGTTAEGGDGFAVVCPCSNTYETAAGRGARLSGWSLWRPPSPSPPCGGRPGWGVALTSQNARPYGDSDRSARPPSLTLPHKGGGNSSIHLIARIRVRADANRLDPQRTLTSPNCADFPNRTAACRGDNASLIA
jgi:hypothetical protein